MRPPECVICGACDAGIELLQFAVDAEAADWHRRAEAEGFAGHPPDQEWFCATHAKQARTLTDRPLREALRVMRAHSKRSTLRRAPQQRPEGFQ